MDKPCNKAEGAQLLETMRKICDATGCKEVEHATLAYEETLREKETPQSKRSSSKTLA